MTKNEEHPVCVGCGSTFVIAEVKDGVWLCDDCFEEEWWGDDEWDED